MRKNNWLLVVGGMLLTVPATAGATECATDADCPAGQVCSPVGCPAMECAPDSECPEVPPCEERGVCVDAWGSECVANADCPAGFVCEVIGATGCASKACPAGEECEARPEEPCESQEIRGCVPPPPPSCQADADCAAGLVCVTYTYAQCSGGTKAEPTCAPDQQCPESDPVDAGGAEEECAEVTEGYCVPPYVAPCQVDADCGPGFACKEAQSCWCSGSTGPAGSGAPAESGMGGSGDADQPADDGAEECGCEPTGELYCELVEQACSVDADCPAGLSCVELILAQADCADVPVSRDGTDPEPGSGNGEAPPADREPCTDEVETARRCTPPDWMIWTGGGAREAQDAAGTAAPYHDSLAGALGAEEVGQPSRAGNGGADKGDGNSGTRSSDSGGCAVADRGLPLSGGLLLLGLALGLRLLGRRAA